MSGNSVKWIPLEGMELNAANLAPAEKLRKFGFSLVCCGFGSEKLTKAGLCIYDVLSEKETPNILVVTTANVLYGWYRTLMTGIGADFKVISGASNEIIFFSADSSNLFLITSDALARADGLRAKVPEDFRWDLVVIDEEHSRKTPDYAALTERIPWKTERLLMITQFPAANEEDGAALSGFVKSKLADEEQAGCAEGLDLTKSALALDYGTPVLMAGDKGICSDSLNVRTVTYSFANTKARRRIDIRSGLPSYKFGGNIFEDFDLEDMKNLYHKPVYTPADVTELSGADQKLAEFLKLADEIMEDDGKRAIVYFSERGTLDFIRKVLSTQYSDSRVRVARSELFSNKDILRRFQVEDKADHPKFLLAMDDIGTVGDGLDSVTHVINYELPSSPVVLQRRWSRHGVANEGARTLVFFADKEDQFDGRMLKKVLYAALPDAFCGGIPARNVLLDIPERAEYLGALLADLRYVHSYSSEVDSCYDLIKRFKSEYEFLGAGRIATARQLADFSGKLLEKLCKFYGVAGDSDDTAGNVNSLNGLCCCTDGALVKVPADEVEKAAASLDADPAAQPFGEEAVSGLEAAKKRIDELHSGQNYHLMIKNDIQSLNDCIQYPVLYGIWKYRVREQDSVRPFRDFIRIYNDGM